MLINTLQIYAILFVLTQKFEQKSELFWFVRLVLQEKKVSVHNLNKISSYNYHPAPK